MTYNTKVYREQGGATMVVASGGSLRFEAGSTMELATGVTIKGLGANLPGNLASGHMDLGPHLFHAREVASGETFASGSTAPTAFFYGQLGPDTTPVLNLTSSGDQSWYLSWASAIVDAIKLDPIAVPTDFSSAAGLTIELNGENIGSATAADAAMGFDIRCWAGVGDTEMGATHPNFTTAPTWKGITLSSADVAAGDVLNVTLVPSAHAGRALRLYGARARYARTS
jgi:hypothetical protein